MLHPDDHMLWDRTQSLAWRMAERFDLPLKVCEPKRRPNGARGLCYHAEGRISILLREKQYAYRGGEWAHHPLDWREIAETVAHELAHLIHPNHGKEFRELEARLVDALPFNLWRRL